MSAVRKARSEPGQRYQLSLLTTEDLKAVLDTAYMAADQIIAYVERVQNELVRRGENPYYPPDVAS